MPSYQSGGPSSKFDKLKTLDPLKPLAPFTAQPGEEPEVVARVVTEQNDSRTRFDRSSVESLANQTAVPSHPAAAASPGRQPPQPTAAASQPAPLPKTRLDLSDRIDHGDGKKGQLGKKAEISDSDSDDDYYLEGLDEDPAIVELRQRRLAELQKEHDQRSEKLAKGHGEYRTISQDEFLPECTASAKHHVVVHFFHKEFERCKIMDHHLGKIAPKYIGCKFLRIDAEKAPFFIVKLQVKTLPTVIVFLDGKAVNRLTGFEGLVSETRDPDEWRTHQLLEWLDSVGAIEYDGDEELEDGSSDLPRKFNSMKLTTTTQRSYDEDF